MKIMSQVSERKTSESDWKGLYLVGGGAALFAGVLFRRNIAAEIELFSSQKPPVAVGNWFELLQSNRFLGLSYLNIFDIVNYVLVGLMFLALFAALKREYKSSMVIAASLGFLGIGVYLATNTAFSMLSLSDQFAAETTDAQRNLILAAGEALLVINRFSSPGAQPGSGGLLSLLLIAATGMITSSVMLKGGRFNKITAYVGILAGGLDLVYCIAYIFLPAVESEVLAVLFIPAAGLLLMVWHILIGWRLIRLWMETPPNKVKV
jgi:hypothetical protein